MKFKDKNGNTYESIAAAREAFCPATELDGAEMCMKCSISRFNNGKGGPKGMLCEDYVSEYPREAAQAMGYESIEDAVPTPEYNTKREYIEREAAIDVCWEEYNTCLAKADYCGDSAAWNIRDGIMELPAADVIEADCLGRVGRLMLPYKGCPRGPIGRLGMAGGKTQDKKAILIEELCCMDTFGDVDGNVWRPVREEVLQEVIEILRKEADTLC